MCRKMRSKPAKRVVQAGLDRSDRTVDNLSDLRQVETVHVMEHDHEPVLGPELFDRAEHESAQLGLFRDVRGGSLIVGDWFVDRVVQGRRRLYERLTATR